MPASCQHRPDYLESLLRERKLDHTLTHGASTAALASTRWVVPTGIAELDARLDGGIPRGHLSEVVGPRSSGRLAILVSALAAATSRGEAVALIDPLDMFDPVSASASGIDFQRMLWIRGEASSSARVSLSCEYGTLQKSLDRAVKALNIVLQAGGFGVVVLDLGEVAAQTIKRLPYTTWLRLHRVIEGSETACVLIGSEPIARSSGRSHGAVGARSASGSEPERACHPSAKSGERPACSRAFICRRLLTQICIGVRGKGQGKLPTLRPTMALVQLARDFSPRVETHGDRTVTLDISGLGSLIGEPRSIGEELRRTAADAGLRVHIAVASTSTAAILLAHARAGLTVVARGEEAAALAPLPLDLLTQSGSAFAPGELPPRAWRRYGRQDG